MVEANDTRLILAGFGSSSPLQLTVEAQQWAARVGQVLTLGLPERARLLLARQGVQITALDEVFSGRPFAEGYAAVAQAVLARVENDPPAMFLSQGSPLFVNAITRYLVAEGNRRELGTRILPGVSPVDVVVAELGIDVATVGLQTISARGLISRPVALNPRSPVLLLELAGLASEVGSAESYGPLVQLLQEKYPEEQAVTLINMPGSGNIARATVSLRDFGQLVPSIDASSCLFIDLRRNPKAAIQREEPA